MFRNSFFSQVISITVLSVFLFSQMAWTNPGTQKNIVEKMFKEQFILKMGEKIDEIRSYSEDEREELEELLLEDFDYAAENFDKILLLVPDGEDKKLLIERSQEFSNSREEFELSLAMMELEELEEGFQVIDEKLSTASGDSEFTAFVVFLVLMVYGIGIALIIAAIVTIIVGIVLLVVGNLLAGGIVTGASALVLLGCIIAFSID